jgi:cytidylate kinase
MSIITISRGSYSRGSEAAEKVARKLGFMCISREVILEASDQFNVPEAKLVRAVHDAPSVLDRFTYGREKFVAYVRAALLKHVQKDNVVYHGFAGHFFLREVLGVLKVRITADIGDRVREVMRRDGITADEARSVIAGDDEERRTWSQRLYGVDNRSAELYDLVLNIKDMTVDDAVELIVHNVGLPCFQMTADSQAVLDDLALAARIQAVLIEDFPSVRVSVKNRMAFVSISGSLRERRKQVGKARSIVRNIEGVEGVQVHFAPFVVAD